MESAFRRFERPRESEHALNVFVVVRGIVLAHMLFGVVLDSTKQSLHGDWLSDMVACGAHCASMFGVRGYE